MDKIDYKKVFKECYSASAQPVVVDVAPMQFLMFDGEGDPETTPRFKVGVETLFKLAYALKSLIKRGPIALDFTVMPLEGLWWTEGGIRFADDRAAWQWTLMIMQPPVVSAAMVEEAVAALRVKRAPLSLKEVRFERFDEGRSVQALHVGPFAQEGPAIERLYHFAAAQGFQLRGKHHEIYLSDMGRSPPEKWKTILRQPVV